MNHRDHVALIQRGVRPGGTWAELGSGRGAFTAALAELLGPGSTLFAVDRDGRALDHLSSAVTSRYPGIELHAVRADFTGPLAFLPPLDGLLLANALHFVAEKGPLLASLRGQLLPQGRLLIVEYDTDRGNRWVPYPFSFDTWRRLAEEAGFAGTELLGTHPSRFLGRFYAALST